MGAGLQSVTSNLQDDIAGASRPSGRLVLASLAGWIVLAILLPLSALTLNAFHLGKLPLGFWLTAQGVLIGLVVLVAAYAWRAGGTGTREGGAAGGKNGRNQG